MKKSRLLGIAALVLAISISTSTNASSMVINELLANPAGADSGNEWIELFNNGPNPVDVSGWIVQKATSSAYTDSFVIPGGTGVDPGNYLVIGGTNVSDADLNTSSLGFGNGSGGDAVRLMDNSSSVIDTVVYGPDNSAGILDDTGSVATSIAPNPTSGFTLGRIPNGVDTDASGVDFVLSSYMSVGVSNIPNLGDMNGDGNINVGDLLLLIQEIMNASP